MAFSFNWKPQQIPTQMKGAQFAPQKVGLDQDFPSLVNGAIGRSPEEIAVEQNLNERQVGNADDMANWIQQGGTPQADAAAAAQQEDAAKQQRIAEIEAEITEIRNRISERKMAMAANEDDLNSQLAGIEARKINSQDPTMFWRWKVGQDQQRELAKQAKSADDTAKANAMIEIANDLDSIIVDESMDSTTRKTYLSKLANLKTLGEKAGVPKSVIDNIEDKIKEVKGNGGEQTSREQATTDFETLLKNPNLSVELLDKFEATNPNLSRANWGILDNKRAELVNKADKKSENEAKAKARETKILGMNPNSSTSDEISFMEKRGYKRVTGDKLSDTKWVKVK